MTHQKRDGWFAHFLEADCMTTVNGRSYRFAKLEELRSMLERMGSPAEALEELERDEARWGRGAIWLDLSDEQYRKLKDRSPRRVTS